MFLPTVFSEIVEIVIEYGTTTTTIKTTTTTKTTTSSTSTTTKTTTSTTTSTTTTTTIKPVENQTFGINLSAGWNMVSLPLTPVNNSVYALFKGITTLKIKPVVTWNAPLFIEVEKLYPKIGYWVFTPSSMTVNIIGKPIENKTLELKTGWNMVGTTGLGNLNNSCIPNQVTQKSSVSWNTPLFVETNQTKPGTASWVFVTAGTTITIDKKCELGP